MKNIKEKILICMAATVICSLLLVGGISVILNYTSTMDLLEQTMEEIAQVASERVEKELLSYKNVAYDAGSIARLANPGTSVEDKKAILEQRALSHNMVGYNLVNQDGISIFDGNDYSDREYIQEALKGRTFVSEPLLSKVTGKISVMIAAPLWEGGIPDSKVIGVIYFKPTETFLSDIVNTIQISENGTAYMINKNGTTIAHISQDKVAVENIEELAQSEKSLKNLASIHTKMRAGQSGFGNYKLEGKNKVIAYTPVEGTDGWSIAVVAPKSDFMGTTVLSIIITIALLLAASVIAILLARWLAKGISTPIGLCCDRLELLAKGDLASEVPQIESKDETGRLAASTNTIVATFQSIIGDVNAILEAFSIGNFQVTSQTRESYAGDFEKILLSMRSLKEDLGKTLSAIRDASDQVSIGSRQMAESAQALAEGATDQAGAVEELTASIENVSEISKESAKNAKYAYQMVDKEVEESEYSRKDMQKLTEAMKNIQETSKQIQNIIVAIEDIASQTNMLSLNASIEAARAGEAGRGFAVVAEQIGKLANDSAQSAVETKDLIAQIVIEIEKGNKLSDMAVSAFEKIAKSMESFSSMARGASEASEQQAGMLEQIEQGIEQISVVVQSNSAAAQETSATSEELSAQSENMNSMVDKFKF